MRIPIREFVRPAWMTRDAGLVVGGRGAMSVSRALAGVITPIYLAEIGWSGFKIGVLFGAVAIASAILSAAVGLLSDRFGRKPFLMAVPLLAGGAGIVFASTDITALLFIAASIGSFGRGGGAGGGTVGPYQPAEQALLTESVQPRHRNSMFGRLAFASAAGALIGNQLAVLPDVLGHFGASLQGSYHPAFLVVSGFTFLASVIVLPIREPKSSAQGQRPSFRLPRKSMRFLVKLWIANSVNGFAIGFVGPLLTYWLHVRYGVGPGAIGTLNTIINVASMVSVLSAPAVAQRLGLVKTVVISRFFQSVLLVAMVWMPTFWLAGLMYLLRMLVNRIGMPLRQSYVMAMVDPSERSSVAGLANLPSQGTSSASPLLGGWMLDNLSLTIPFEIAAFFQLLNTGFFFVFFRNMAPPEETERAALREGRLEPGPLPGAGISNPRRQGS